MAANPAEIANPINNGRCPETGQFLKGNPGGGRPMSSRHKIAEAFLKDFHGVWEEKGQEAIVQLAENNPVEFVKIAASMVPKEQKLNISELRTFVVELTGQSDQDFIEHEDLPRLDIANPDTTHSED